MRTVYVPVYECTKVIHNPKLLESNLFYAFNKNKYTFDLFRYSCFGVVLRR